MTTQISGVDVYGAIEEKWRASGGVDGPLGVPLSNEAPTYDGIGRNQAFQGGAMSWHPDLGAFLVVGSICARWRELGAEQFGYPTTDEKAVAHGPGRYNTFRAMQLDGRPESSIYWTEPTGAHEVYGTIRDRWAQSGWEDGPLGYPVAPEAPTYDGIGRNQAFQGGAMSWHPEIGAFLVVGSICARWRELGAEQFGYPTTDEKAVAHGPGRYNTFRAMQLDGRPESSIYWTEPTGAHEVYGAVRDRWAQSGWEDGPLGYPVAPEAPTYDGIGRNQAFQGGAMSWHPELGAFVVPGAICARWRELGAEQLGYPVIDETAAPDGVGRYLHLRAMHLDGRPDSSIYWTPDTGAHEVYGAIRDRWARRGWEAGALGYPTGAEHDRPDAPGREQTFQHGRIVWSEAGALCDPLVLRADIVTGGLAALGGNVSVTIGLDGSVVWQGHAHDSGMDGYDFGISAVVRGGSGFVGVGVAHTGSVGGTFTSGDSDHDWSDVYPLGTGEAARIRSHLLDLNDGDLQTDLQYSSDFGSVAESLVSFAVKAVVGTVTGGAGLVVFLGVEAGSLLATGSLVPGARVLEGVLWLAGPANTLYALAAAGIARVGSSSRELSVEEYDWANSQVFSGALPPRDTIQLTDTIGPEDRAFTFPTFDGHITLNMGEAAFADPRGYEKPYGRTLVHELVHACQIHHSTDLALIAEALSAKACEATGGDPYAYGGAPLDYRAQNLEQQAQIVSDWYAGTNVEGAPGYRGGNQTGVPRDSASPYFDYIAAHVRTGDF